MTNRCALVTLLASADVVLAPDPVETFGLAAVEALACGTPVVADVDSAVPEVVGPGRRGGTRRGVYRGGGRGAGVLIVAGRPPAPQPTGGLIDGSGRKGISRKFAGRCQPAGDRVEPQTPAVTDRARERHAGGTPNPGAEETAAADEEPASAADEVLKHDPR